MKRIAVKIYKGEIFTSLQMVEREMALLPMVFMQLSLMDNEQRAALAALKPEVLYGHVHTAHRSCNGYPCMMDLYYLTREEWTVVAAALDKLKDAEEAL